MVSEEVVGFFVVVHRVNGDGDGDGDGSDGESGGTVGRKRMKGRLFCFDCCTTVVLHVEQYISDKNINVRTASTSGRCSSLFLFSILFLLWVFLFAPSSCVLE